MEQEYEYIRHHGSWKDFNNNLDIIRTLDHKISFNMLHLILNYRSIFNCVDYLKEKDFHDNSFIIGPLYGPDELNLLNLPEPMINDVKAKLTDRLALKPTGYLKNSYENLLQYFSTTEWDKNISLFYEKTKLRDQRRAVDSKKIFPNLYKELDAYTLE